MIFAKDYKSKLKIENQNLNKIQSFYLPLALITFGAIIRFVYLGVIPGGLHNDEVYAGWNAYSLYTGGIDSAGYRYPVYFEAWGHGQSALYTYLILPLIYLNKGQLTALIVRLPQAIVAVLSIWVFYLVLKKLFNQRMALWGLFLIAINPWHITMSRWALDANLAPGFLLFGFYFFVRGLEKEKYLLLSAFFYGLSLYCYAVIWPVLPIILFLQITYGIYIKKLHFNKNAVFSTLILFLFALPLMLFLLINKEYLPSFLSKYFSIYKMSSIRDGEMASSWSEIIANFKRFFLFFKNQKGEMPYDIIEPYGIFYHIGMVFLIIGAVIFFSHLFKCLKKRELHGEFLIVAWLFGGILLGGLIPASLHKINCIYLPLIMIEAYGMTALHNRLKKKNVGKGTIFCYSNIILFLLCFSSFEIAYYTDYKELVAAYNQEDMDDAIEFAMEKAQEKNGQVAVNDAIKYPKVLFYTKTTALEYQSSLVYSDYIPAPSQFTVRGITFYFGFQMDQLSSDTVYIVYETEVESFSEFQLTPFGHYYVAVCETTDATLQGNS